MAFGLNVVLGVSILGEQCPGINVEKLASVGVVPSRHFVPTCHGQEGLSQAHKQKESLVRENESTFAVFRILGSAFFVGVFFRRHVSEKKLTKRSSSFRRCAPPPDPKRLRLSGPLN